MHKNDSLLVDHTRLKRKIKKKERKPSIETVTWES